MLSVGSCRLNKILREKRVTQSELAELVNMTKQRINDYCSGRKVMSLQTAVNISHALGVYCEDLYDFIQVEKK